MLEHQCEIGTVEIWKDIQGFEGFYQVSNLGRIKSLARMRRGKKGCEVPILEMVMKATRKKDTGRTKPYEEIRLRKNQDRDVKSKCFLVHRLVGGCETWSPDHVEPSLKYHPGVVEVLT